MAEDNDTQDWAADCDGEGRERAVRDGRDSGVVMMDAAAEYGGNGRRWQQWARTAMTDDDIGGQQRWWMTTACKIERRTMRGEEEGGRQTTTALGQLGRERETTFFSNTVCPVGVFDPAENKLLSF